MATICQKTNSESLSAAFNSASSACIPESSAFVRIDSPSYLSFSRFLLERKDATVGPATNIESPLLTFDNYVERISSALRALAGASKLLSGNVHELRWGDYGDMFLTGLDCASVGGGTFADKLALAFKILKGPSGEALRQAGKVGVLRVRSLAVRTAPLTKSEEAALLDVAAGNSVESSAARLGLSAGQIRHVRTEAYPKIGIRSGNENPSNDIIALRVLHYFLEARAELLSNILSLAGINSTAAGFKLTPTMLQILRERFSGKNLRETAKVLGKDVGAVRASQQRLFGALQVHSTQSAVLVGLREGFLSPVYSSGFEPVRFTKAAVKKLPRRNQEFIESIGTLTDAELLALTSYLKGRSLKQAARETKLSEGTIDVQRRDALKRIGFPPDTSERQFPKLYLRFKQAAFEAFGDGTKVSEYLIAAVLYARENLKK